MIDKNEKALKNGDIIDLHQTVNGENKFIMLDVDKLHMVYEYDPSRIYEYDVEDALKPCVFTGESDWEIVGNIDDSKPEPRSQMVSFDDVHDQVSARLAMFLARYCVARPFEHVEFEVECSENGSMTFVPKNFFTALLYEQIYFPEAINGAKTYETNNGKFVWEEDRLWFASLKQ